MLFRVFLILLFVTGCGRPLTDAESAFLQSIHGDALDQSRLRLVDGALVGDVTFERKPRPRVTCRERIVPPVKREIVTVSPAGVTIFNRVYLAEDWYLDDYVPDFPDRINLSAAMLLAHEATHVWQWQNRKLTKYHPLKAAAEHSAEDPYLFDPDDTRNFLEFGYEQQGAIVEEYVCCRALDPTAPRTERLHNLLAAVMPVSDLPKRRTSDVWIPWKDAKIEGICT
ncbi:MAG: hypothetical protein AB3N23_08125 [Paracoccaceae bacterium]